jgi:hypothetical protein
VEGRVFDAYGTQLEEATYLPARRRADTESVAWSVLVGLVVAGPVTGLLAWFPWYRWQLLSATGLGLVMGGLAAVGVARLHAGLWSPYATTHGYFDAHQTPLEYWDYARLARASLTTSVLLGVLAGTGVLAAMVGLWLFRYHQHVRRIRADLAARTAGLLGEFGEMFTPWGGAEGLSRSRTIEEILKTVEVST